MVGDPDGQAGVIQDHPGAKDLRPHVEAFALAKGAKYGVEKSAPLASDGAAAAPPQGSPRHGRADGIESMLEKRLRKLGDLAQQKVLEHAERERSAA